MRLKNILRADDGSIKNPRLLTAIIITTLFFLIQLIFNLIPDETLNSKVFYRTFPRSLGFIMLLFVLAYVATKNRFTQYISPLFVTVGFILAFDTIFLVLHFKDQLFPKEQAAEEVTTSQPQRSFNRIETPHSIIDYTRGYGFANRISDTVKVQLEVNGEQLPDVFYVTDEVGRRVFLDAKNEPKEKYALFLGCSVTFGLNVADSLTLPACFEKNNPEYRAYNYGIPASGPNQYLAMFENENVDTQIPEKNGIAVYSFFDHHVNRAISDFATYEWNNGTPYYVLQNESLKRDGDFKHGRWLLSTFFDLIRGSYFIKYIHFNYPKKLVENHYRLTTAIIARTRDLYVKQFDNNNFYVLLLPGFDTGIVPFLQEHRIKYFDYRNSIPEYWADYTFPIDNHPTGKAYRILADSLTLDLQRDRR